MLSTARCKQPKKVAEGSALALEVAISAAAARHEPQGSSTRFVTPAEILLSDGVSGTDNARPTVTWASGSGWRRPSTRLRC
eukprot:3588134-Prymnesium_polylepis.1